MSLLRTLRFSLKQHQWRKSAADISEPTVSAFYRQMHLKFSAPFTETAFLAADLEMTGLDAKKDHIVSIGYVPVVDGNIVLADATHILISSDREMGESATIHHIRDQDLQKAAPLALALRRFFRALEGRVLLLHHAPLDMAFLNAACEKVFGTTIKLPVVDTLKLEHHRLLKRTHPLQEGELRLFNCRRRYHLPDMPNHNALSDALATAELFLAITAHKGKASDIRLADLLTL